MLSNRLILLAGFSIGLLASLGGCAEDQHDSVEYVSGGSSSVSGGAGLGGDSGSGGSGISGSAGISGTSGSGTAGFAAGSAGSGTSGSAGSGTAGIGGSAGAGTSGSSGSSGSGTAGKAGASGSAGAGTSGSPGTSGSAGMAGKAGASGSAGAGTSGSTGTSGSAGVSGSAGASGSIGTSGSAGVSGSGTSGSSGTAGASGTGSGTCADVSETFDSGLPSSWVLSDSAAWSVAGMALVGTGKAQATGSSASCGDQTVEADVNVTNFGSPDGSHRAGLVVRYTGSSAFYALQVDGTGALVLRRSTNTLSGTGCSDIAAGIAAGTSHKLKLQVSGPAGNVTLKSYLDGTPQHTCTTTSSPSYASGSAGAIVYQVTSATFDNFVITSP